MSDQHYAVVVVGTSFASTFFLHRYLRDAPDSARVLVLEWGQRREHSQMIREQLHSELTDKDTVVNEHPSKRWVSNLVFGGNSNCWWACTPRMLPADFELATRYGVGTDWPLSYDELEPYYAQAEELLSVSGPAYPSSLYPRSRPFPQPPHRLCAPGRALHAANPGLFFPQATARARVATPKRPACCASGTCNLCPINAKFTVQAEMSEVYQDPRVTLKLGCEARRLELVGGAVRGVEYAQAGRTSRAAGDLVVLGANALFNPTIMLRSGLTHSALGAYLNEQVGIGGQVFLDGMDCFDGSTSMTVHGYPLYDGEHRRAHAAGLIEISNNPLLRPEFGRWRQRFSFKVIYEDIPSAESRVVLDSSMDQPRTQYAGHSAYAQRAVERMLGDVKRAFAALPIERIELGSAPGNESHIMGTTRMGTDAETSVVDRDLRHHTLRNLLVLGTGTFPSSAPANPTLTLCALSLRAAERLWR